MVSAIVAEGLGKRYGATTALDELDLAVETGTVSALLGPNGAGKTTTVAILTTLLPPDSGRATVDGYDVVREAGMVRQVIGLSGQFAALDDGLTGRENLDLFGRLQHLGRATAHRRATELIDRFGLSDVAGRPVKTYSGGMRRRLDVAASLVAAPAVLFLDEPTTGLDPTSRQTVWEMVADLVQGGTTLLLTTQYLEEADRLAHRIVVVDHGRVIAQGTADELKDAVGGGRLELVVTREEDLPAAARAVRAASGDGEATEDRSRRLLSAPVSGQPELLAAVIRELAVEKVAVDELAVRRPTLDDVFFSVTGHAAAPPAGSPDGSEADRASAAAGRDAR